MRALLVAVNSSYVHTNPAVRSLSAASAVPFMEFNINQDSHDILRSILSYQAEIVAFSCYIWNIGHVLRIAEDLKKSRPGVIVIMGGPEASFCAEDMLESRYADYVVCGEAEESLKELLGGIERGNAGNIRGVLYREAGQLAGNGEYRLVNNMQLLPGPFSAGDRYDGNKIYYYESSRGCPFSCAYCMSGSLGGTVREKPLDQVKREINEFVERDVKLVKFTDRTFNANRARAREIVRFVLKKTGNTCFHFEVALDLMDEEMLSLLRCAPEGKIQLEAGVQTTNTRTLEAVMRRMDLEKLKRNARAILEQGNIHLHLDLIAGLPYEGLNSFRTSFNDIYELYPDALQLGFLKLLPGTGLRRKAEKYGIIYRSYAPYEVIRTNDISAEELLFLKGVEGLLNRYYNTGRARHGLDYLTKNQILEPFELYERLYAFCEQEDYASRPLSAKNQFVALIEYAKKYLTATVQEAFFAALRKDYDQTKIKGQIPEELSKII
ncbi:B12-binding domain-containing radical SAM protein [Christensenella intestinihominis]|nr:radical SAM protein [Christensenella intestinihominis]